jgi:hypothetical protein
MSLDLTVKLLKPVEITSLLEATRGVACEILDVPSIPALQVYKLENGVISYPVESGLIAYAGQALEIVMDEVEESIALYVIDVPGDSSLTAQETGLHIGIAAYAIPIACALAASSAIALARLTGSLVIDDGLAWSPLFEQSPYDFAATVQIVGPFENVQDAANAFYAAMLRRTT